MATIAASSWTLPSLSLTTSRTVFTGATTWPPNSCAQDLKSTHQRVSEFATLLTDGYRAKSVQSNSIRLTDSRLLPLRSVSLNRGFASAFCSGLGIGFRLTTGGGSG